jgi:hypothetical protein
MNALAYQADPGSIDPGKLSPNSSRVRRARQSHGRSMSVQSSLDPYGSNTTLSSSGSGSGDGGHTKKHRLKDPHSEGLPKIRKAKSQSFRTHRRSPSERRSPSGSFLSMEHGARLIKRNSIGQRSPSNSIYESHAKSPSPSTQSQKSSLSRQGTVRASHRRKNSASHSLNLSDRRSPLMPDRSPSGRKSPNFLSHDLPPFQDDRKSPTRSPSGKRSPLGFSQSFNLPITAPDRLRSSPSKEMAIQCWNERMKSPTTSIHMLDRKSPVSFTGPNTGGFYLEPRRSPINQLPIPPITISNPSETCGLSPKSVDSGRVSPRMHFPSPIKGEQSPVRDKSEGKDEKPEKPEKKSVMREILAFVRKPSKKVSSRTSRFAAAFSKSSNSDSNAPLVRQSTFSNMPASSSRAGRAAVTKQMSYEPKISSKLKSVGSKMSLRLRRATETKKDKKSSGDEVSDLENSERFCDEISDMEGGGGLYCEFENVYFEKVHKKVEQIVEEEDSQERFNEGASTSRNGGLEKPRNLYEELKRSIETLFENNKDPHYENIDCYRRDKSKSIDTDEDIIIPTKTTIQCPIIGIEPPSRRASFDPPRSPYLENFRSLSDTDHDVPSGESFEVVDTNHRESSFEDRYSSMDTSFDISRYHSTSYEDQTSSFEIVDSHLSDSQTPQPQQQQQQQVLQTVKEDKLKASNVDLSKSSIEIVDPETFQKSCSQASGRKSSLETHFDLSDSYQGRSAFASTSKTNECFPIGMKATHQASLLLQQPSRHRTRSPILSNQTSSNYSSRDSYESSSTYEPTHSRSHSMTNEKNPFSDITKHHYPMPRKYSNDRTFLCIDKRCASIFEPRSQQSPRTSITSATCNVNQQLLNTTDTSSGSEFEAPSPRRALSASPKHTFTFRIVMKKVESSPEDLCFSNCAERQCARQTRERERQRRDSRRRKSRLNEGKGKSF